MERILQSDIFFFITSIAAIIVTIGLALVLFEAYKILRSVKKISADVEETVIEARGTISDVRGRLAAMPGLGFLLKSFKSHPSHSSAVAARKHLNKKQNHGTDKSREKK
ncbi:MAG: hypothetical protein V4526_02470 [Patescibacteria group bacterium]